MAPRVPSLVLPPLMTSSGETKDFNKDLSWSGDGCHGYRAGGALSVLQMANAYSDSRTRNSSPPQVFHRFKAGGVPDTVCPLYPFSYPLLICV